MARSHLACVLVINLLAHSLCLPTDLRKRRGSTDNVVDLFDESKETVGVDEIKTNNMPSNPAATLPPAPSSSYEDRIKEIQESSSDDDDDFDFEPMTTSQSAGGSSGIFSLLNLASALFPGSSGGNVIMRNMLQSFIKQYGTTSLHHLKPLLRLRRSDVVVKTALKLDTELKPPPLVKQEIAEDSESSEDSSEESNDSNSQDNEIDSDDDSKSTDGSNDSKQVDANNGNENAENGNEDREDTGDDDGNDDDDDDEPPEGDGNGGGILGLLAGLSGGEDGSDLGTLLATVGGIVANLSGDGVDINALIASGLGLFVGLLSEGDQNPGEILASYLLTSLDTLTGGGSDNNGAFFGKFVSKLIRGISAYKDPNAESEEEGNEMKDSIGFIVSLISALLGDMSKGSSGGSSHR